MTALKQNCRGTPEPSWPALIPTLFLVFSFIMAQTHAPAIICYELRMLFPDALLPLLLSLFMCCLCYHDHTDASEPIWFSIGTNSAIS